MLTFEINTFLFLLTDVVTHSWASVGPNCINNSFLRERGMEFTLKTENQVFLCIFQKNSAMDATQCAFFQDLFHLSTAKTWFYGLIHPQKMAFLGSFQWDFEVCNGFSMFQSNFSFIWEQKLKKIIPGTLKKCHFSSVFFKFYLRFAKLFKYVSANGDLLKVKIDQNDLANVHALSNPATFESNGC